MIEYSMRKTVKDKYKEYGIEANNFASETVVRQRRSLMLNRKKIILLWIEDYN